MKARVLIVDDEEAVRSSLKMIFEYEGYDTLQAANGHERRIARPGTDEENAATLHGGIVDRGLCQNV